MIFQNRAAVACALLLLVSASRVFAQTDASTPPSFAPPSPAVATTESLNPYDDNRVDVLHYRTAAQKLLFSTALETSIHDERKDFSNGLQAYTHDYSTLDYIASLEYGVLDNFYLGISMNYLINETDDRLATSSGASDAFRFNGFGNPDLRADYRFLGGLSGKKFAEVFIDFLPSLGDSRDASTAVAGNHLSSTSIGGGLNTTWIFGNDELFAQGSVQYEAESTVKGATSATDNEKLLSTVLGNIQLRDRYHFNSMLSASFGLIFNFPFTRDYSYPNESPVFDGESSTHFNVEPQISLGWHVYDKVFLSATYEFVSRTVRQKSTNNQTVSIDETDYNQQFLTLAGSFEF